MLLTELSNLIQNPMEKEDIIDKIIEAYLDEHSFYGNIVKFDSKRNNTKVVSKYYQSHEDAFYLYLFEEWKAAINYVAKRAIKKYPYRYRYEAKLLNRYLDSKKPETAQDVRKILSGQDTEDEDIRAALECLRFDSYSLYTSWNHFDSSNIYAKTHSQTEINHRLYINCDSTVIYLIAFEFMRKCKERKLKFYYKFDIYADRDDVIVVYSNTKNLSQYVEILEEIKREHDLDNHLYEPPFLTGKMSGWIGYGSEPVVREKRYSFNTLREKHLEKCIHQEVGSWIRNNAHARVMKDGKTMYYYEYLVYVILNQLREKLIRNRRYSSYTTYTDEELNSKEFEFVVIKALCSRIHDILDYFEGKSNFDEMIISYKGKKIYFAEFDFRNVFKLQLKLLSNNIDSFKDDLRKRIQETSKDFGISDNYAIDQYIVELLEKEQEETSLETRAKVRRKRREWKPMTDGEIEEARRKLRLV